ncbi:MULTISPECIES: PepSY-associated TM helix domain-containing protein [unclassified Spirosoma]|uniref:PepSY-associated TM helix domain-containing protein n=1 Tax=unclassified Spirosoma TaxID=2621999 RepID=UPI00095A6E66|nr:MULTISPECIES: PepSY-associated TM helix domain-containing protein [unclassified Spirosoma]MBN8821405.1 PepSY-associated TM helix domain-containing protein [Spirosoma sp.]OJW78189.1 MAG: peptidase [Spirosoma sp. 48-14]
MSKSQQQPWITAKKQQLANGHPTRQQPTPKSAGGVRWAGVVRWLHLYLSVVSFILVLFFAVTGLTLNHADWFDDATQTTELKGKLNPAWVAGTDTGTVNKLAIVEYLRATHQLKGMVSEFRIDDRECSLSFHGPGYSADAFVKRPDGTYAITETKMGMMAVLNDLHKGRDTGRGWAWVIDIAAVFMTMVSLTGLALLLVLKKRRVSGLGWLVIGGIATGLAYWLLVV